MRYVMNGELKAILCYLWCIEQCLCVHSYINTSLNIEDNGTNSSTPQTFQFPIPRSRTTN